MAPRGRPRWLWPGLLAMLTVALVCAPQQRSDLDASFHVTGADVAASALIAVALFAAIRDRRRLPRRLRVLALPAVAIAAATIAAVDPAAGLSGVVRYLEIFVLVPLAVTIAVRDELDRRLIAGSVLCAAVLQAALGCWQAWSGTGASYDGQPIRAVGTFGAVDVMGMATVVSYGIIVALAFALHTRGRGRYVALGLLALLATALVLSLSRGSWLATFAACAVMVLLSGRRKVLAVAGAGALAAVLVLGGGLGSDMIKQRFASITAVSSTPDQSVNDRYGLWETATGMWADHPLLGVGPRGFVSFRDRYAPLQVSAASDTSDPVNGFQREELRSPHNMYLLVLSEQGLVGLLAFVLMWGALAVWSAWRVRRARSRADRMAGLFAAGWLTWQLTDFLYADIGGAPTVIMSIMLGLTVSWAVRARPGLREAPAV
ncbi:MAG: O-antigen ligase family protein [Nonomuraea sp.]|nr:O-antigen ligase family protein [Nonomuraea sp.]